MDISMPSSSSSFWIFAISMNLGIPLKTPSMILHPQFWRCNISLVQNFEKFSEIIYFLRVDLDGIFSV